MKTQTKKLTLPVGFLGYSFTNDNPKNYAFLARFVRAGVVKAADGKPSNIIVTPKALQASLDMFNNKAVFIDHSGFFQYPSLRNLVAVTRNPEWNSIDQSIDGEIIFNNTPDAKIIAELLLEFENDEEHAPDVGLSMVFWPTKVTDQSGNIQITAINHVESIDLVFQPAADGRILQALSALSIPPTQTQPQELTHMSIQDTVKSFKQEASAPCPTQEASAPCPTQETLAPYPPNQGNQGQDWQQAATRTIAQTMINAADLPQVSKDRLNTQNYSNPAQVIATIEAEKTYLASLVENQVINLPTLAPRGHNIQVGQSGFDQLKLAVDALIDGTRPPNGIRPLTGIRELYSLLSGDYELSGLFHADRVQFANVDCSTMASLVANALNKRVVNEFMQYPAWWEPFTTPEDFATLQEVKWITLAGVQELPTVAEGAAYTELLWDDHTEPATFVKKGGYLGITLEAIDKDDTGRIRSAPGALARAAYITLSKAVSNIFTAQSGTGPDMADTYPVFDNTHSNLGTSDLSSASWAATRVAMRTQTELDSGAGSPANLGALTAPKFLLVPNELENTALQVLGAATAGSANYLDNTFAEGDTHMQRMLSARSRIIVVDMWTDAKDWAAVADPRFYPTIGIGYRYGRTPEIFSVASPNAGLMFTNDIMPVKVRFFFAVGPMDWRGLYKHNVT